MTSVVCCTASSRFDGHTTLAHATHKRAVQRMGQPLPLSAPRSDERGHRGRVVLVHRLAHGAEDVLRGVEVRGTRRELELLYALLVHIATHHQALAEYGQVVVQQPP